MTGEEIRAAREARGWSRAELAARSGLDSDTIRRIEEQGQAPQARTLRMLRAALTMPQGDAPERTSDLARLAAAAARLPAPDLAAAAAFVEALAARSGFDDSDEGARRLRAA